MVPHFNEQDLYAFNNEQIQNFKPHPPVSRSYIIKTQDETFIVINMVSITKL